MLLTRGPLLSACVHNSLVFQGVRTCHSLSYVEWVRKLEFLKKDEEKCSQVLPSGRFLLFDRSRPLLESFDSSTQASEMTQHYSPLGESQESPPLQISWLNFHDVHQISSDLLTRNVLIDLSETGVPSFAVQLSKLEERQMKVLLSSHPNSSFQDIRAALLSLSKLQSSQVCKANSLFNFHKLRRFCGACGTETFRNAAGSERHCGNCNTRVYPSSDPVSIVLVADEADSKVLLVRQGRHPMGMYSCIAGFVDAGETIEQCVRREVAEEAGVFISDDIRYLKSQLWPFPGSLMAGCIATALTHEISMDEHELEDARWFSRSELAEALSLSNKDSMSFLAKKSPFFIPPPFTIANQLMRHWIENTQER